MTGGLISPQTQAQDMTLTNKFFCRVYLFLISKEFPLWLALMGIVGLSLDLVSTSQVIFTDKSLFLARESNEFVKNSYITQQWYLYSVYIILTYFILILLAKILYYPVFRIIIMNVIILQAMAPITWTSMPYALIIPQMFIVLILFKSVTKFLPKKIEIRETVGSNASLIPC